MNVVSGKKVYALSGTEYANLINVLAVLRQGTDANLENNVDIPFDAYFENNAPVIRLRTPESSGFIVVRFSTPHTLSGLDSATVSTLPAFYDDVLIDGTAYWACVIRSIGRVETINLNQGVTENLSETKEFFKQAFMFGLSQAMKRKSPVSDPNTAAWNDSWHSL